MAYDPSLPANGSPLSSAEMRSQLQGLQALIAAVPAGPPGPPGTPGTPGADGTPGAPGEVSTAQLATAIGTTSANSNGVAPLGATSFSDPPTRVDLQLVASKLDELINALRR
jgi:hypothetical protein